MSACVAFEEDLAALALKTLTGRRRGEVMSHVAGCQRCVAELVELTEASDLLLVLAPEAEAPLGFESRLAQRLEFSVPATARALWRRPILIALGGTLMLLSALLAGTVVGEHRAPPPATSTHSANLTSAVAGGSAQVVGKATLLSGTPTWLVMTLDYTGWTGRVSCQVTLRGGRTETLGTFRVGPTYDSWTLPIAVPTSDVVGARLVQANGTLLASAKLSR